MKENNHNYCRKAKRNQSSLDEVGFMIVRSIAAPREGSSKVRGKSIPSAYLLMNLFSVVRRPLQFRSSHRRALDLQLGLQEDSTDSIIEQGKHGGTRDVLFQRH